MLNESAAAAEYNDIITTHYLSALSRGVSGYGQYEFNDIKISN